MKSRYDEDIAWWRAYADRAREFEGPEAYRRALAQLHQLEDMRDEELAARPQPQKMTIPGSVWLALGLIVLFGVVWALSSWQNFVLACVFVGVAAWLALRWYRRKRARRSARVHPVKVRLAPMPGAAPAAAPIGTVGLAALDPDTTALASALGDKYATAVAEGTVPAAASVRHDNGRVIEARLPAGMVASHFRKTDAAEKLAAALFIPLKRVRVMPSDTPAILRVEVLDVDPEDLPVEGFPLLEGATFDFNKPVPVGLTSERERVEVTFHSHAALFAGQRGSGKTTAMRNVAAAAAIDPDVRLFVVDMKGEDDWSMFAGRADMFVCDTDPRRAEQVIDAAVAERQKRSDLKRANPGMKFPTLLVVIDEFQSLSDSAMVKLEALIKKSRSTAVDVVLGTQAPTKRAGVAVDMLEQIDVRWIGKVESDTMADKVFPRGFREEGVDVSKTRMGLGRAWVVADGQYRLVQTYSTDADDIAAMVRRGPQRAPVPADYDAARESAEATAQDDTDTEPDPLVDLLTTMGDRSGMTWAEVAAELGDDVVGTVRKVTGSGKFRRGETTLRGVRRRDLKAAVDAGT